MRRYGLNPLVALGVAGLLAACSPAADPASEVAPDDTGDDLPVGDALDDFKADGTWGDALTCKPVPDLPRLSNPRIVISLHGLTLRLVDDLGFEKVFPVGVGQVNTKEGELTWGESLSAYPLLATGRREFAITPSTIQPCKTWWTDPETGTKQPVFAGLPFLSFFGNYAVHGPIDNFRAPNGGNLRRGFVSHGCVRMEAADVLEVYARIRGVARVPVVLQREPDRTASGRRVDVPARWIGAECATDGECSFAGGFCKKNRWSGRGFCSARCASTCADRAGYPTTFCVADPDDATRGMCVERTMAMRPDCRTGDHFVKVRATRFRSTLAADVCVPGSPGWIGDRCFSDGECRSGNRCIAGACSQPCARFCPDLPARPSTFCAKDSAGSACARQCATGADCPSGFDCVPRSNPADPRYVRTVCVAKP